MQEDAAGRHRRPIEEKMEEASPFVAAQKSGQMKRRPDQRGGPSARPNSPRELGKEEIGANRGSRSSSFAVPEAGERKRRSPAPRNEPKNRESDQKPPPSSTGSSTSLPPRQHAQTECDAAAPNATQPARLISVHSATRTTGRAPNRRTLLGCHRFEQGTFHIAGKACIRSSA